MQRIQRQSHRITPKPHTIQLIKTTKITKTTKNFIYKDVQFLLVIYLSYYYLLLLFIIKKLKINFHF